MIIQADKFEELRQMAENLVSHQPDQYNEASADILEVIHELRIHQAELEIQNEELRTAQENLSQLHQEYEDLYEYAPCGYLTLNAKGMITRANRKAVDLLKTDRGFLFFSGYASFLESGWMSPFFSAQKKAAQTCKKQRVDLLLKRKEDAAETWVRTDIEADRNPSGEVTQWRLILHEISREKQVEAELKEKEARSKLIIDHAPILFTIMKNSIITYINQAGCQALQVKRSEECLGKSFFDFIHPEVRHHYQRLLSEKKERTFTLSEEIFLKLRDGKEIFLQVTIIPLIHHDEPVTLMMANDITERKKAEDKISTSLKEKELYLAEIHHRVKNNLQTISGLLGIANAKITDPKTKEIMHENLKLIQTMGYIHNQLYRSKDFRNVDIKRLLNDLVGCFSTSSLTVTGEVSFDMDVEDITLDIDLASPIGLVVNEILTNAAKYAFPDGNGKITLSFHSVKDGGYELMVGDNGIGLPQDKDIDSGNNFGLTLIKNIVENQLKGDVSINRGQGTVYVIRFPNVSTH